MILVYIYIDLNVVFIYGCVQTKIDDDKKCREIADDFDHHADATVQCGAHQPTEHIPSPVVYENFIPQNGPSTTTRLSSSMQQAA